MFTKFEENVSVHQSLADEPNIDNGMSAEELKKLWDKPAEELKKAFNKLIDELGYDIAGNSVGASPLSEGDTSARTVQAKLEYLFEVIQGVSQGSIPDGTITKNKIDSNYSNKIAEKTGELQQGLNAELLNGTSLSEILDIDNKYVAGTYFGGATIDLGFRPKFVVVINTISSAAHISCKGLTAGIEFLDTGFKPVYSNLTQKMTYAYVAFK